MCFTLLLCKQVDIELLCHLVRTKIPEKVKQVGAELCQAQFLLGLAISIELGKIFENWT